MDHLLGSYRPIIRDKKEYWSLVINGIKTPVFVTWWVHSTVQEKPMKHLEFWSGTTIFLANVAISLRLQTGGGKTSHLPNDIWCHGVWHFKVQAAQDEYKVRQEKLCFMFHMSKMLKLWLHSYKKAVCYEILVFTIFFE